MKTEEQLTAVANLLTEAADGIRGKLDEAKAKLAELDKPELKNWDFGYDIHCDKPCDPRIYMDGHHYGCTGGKQDSSPLVFVRGNALEILKDLGRYAKPFEKTEFNNGHYIKTFVEIAGRGVMLRQDDGNAILLYNNTAIEFAKAIIHATTQNLRDQK